MDTLDEKSRPEDELYTPDEQGFDGELVVIADSEFLDYEKFPLIFTDYLRDRILTLDRDVCALLARYNLLVDKTAGLEESRIDGLKEKTNALYQRLLGVWGREVLDIVLSGRIKVATLIDSDGGDGYVSEIYQEAIKYLKRKGGLAETFVTGHAASAGFELMTAADRLYFMNKSHLMWHFSDEEGDRRKQVETLREKKLDEFRKRNELESLYAFLARSPLYNENLKKKFLAEITASNNPDGELIFTAEELVNMGIPAYVYSNLREMSADFADDYDAIYDPEVKDFWLYSDIMAQEADRDGNWIDKNFEERRWQLSTTKISKRVKRYRRLFPTLYF